MFDTNLLIGLAKADPDAQRAFERHNKNRIISAFTWYELMIGCCKIKNRKEHLDELITCLGDTRIMHLDDTIATLAAKNLVMLSKKGRSIGVVDNFIAASCVVNDEVLVTRNVKHFKGIPGLKVEAW